MLKKVPLYNYKFLNKQNLLHTLAELWFTKMNNALFLFSHTESREFMFRICREAYGKHCLHDFNDANDIIPKWHEPEKFKRYI